MNTLPEDEEERRMFNSYVELAGSPLMAVASAINAHYTIAPPDGSLRKQLAIMYNEVLRAHYFIKSIKEKLEETPELEKDEKSENEQNS